MAEYIEREALRKILENWRDAHADVDDEEGYGMLEDVICEVDAQIAADVVPVVRCRDCKYARKSEDAFDWDGVTPLCECNYSRQPNRWHEYCSYGERKAGDSDD